MTKTNYAGTNAEYFHQYVDFLWSWSWSVSENFSPGGTTCDSQGVTRLWKDGCQWVSCDRTCCSGQFEENLQKHMYRVESFKHMLVLNIWWWLSPWIIWWFFQYFWESSAGGCFETSWLDKLTLDDDWRKLLYPMCFARSFALVNWSDGNHWEWL